MADKKTLGNEVPSQVSESAETAQKSSLSKVQDITETTKNEISLEKESNIKNDNPSTLKLEELINIAGNFVRGKIGTDELDEFGEKMIIRSYIPMIEKVRSLMMLVYKLDSDPLQTSEVRIANVYKVLFFDVLLGLYGMVDVSNDELKTYAAYDLLYPIFAPFLLQYCEHDFGEYKKMFEDSLNLTRMKELSELMESIDYEKLAEQNKKVEEILTGLKEDKRTLQNLADIFNATDPNLKKTMDIVQKNLVEEIFDAANGKKELNPPVAKKVTKKSKIKDSKKEGK